MEGISSWNLPVPDLSACLSERWNQPSCSAGNAIILGQFSAFALQLPSPALERLLKSGEARSSGFQPFSGSPLRRRWENLSPELLVSPAAKNDKNTALCEAPRCCYLCFAGGEEGKTKNPKKLRPKQRKILAILKAKGCPNTSVDWNLAGFLVFVCWCIQEGPEQCSPKHGLNSQTILSSWLCPSNCLKYKGVQSLKVLVLTEPGLFMP